MYNKNDSELKNMLYSVTQRRRNHQQIMRVQEAENNRELKVLMDIEHELEKAVAREEKKND